MVYLNESPPYFYYQPDFQHIYLSFSKRNGY